MEKLPEHEPRKRPEESGGSKLFPRLREVRRRASDWLDQPLNGSATPGMRRLNRVLDALLPMTYALAAVSITYCVYLLVEKPVLAYTYPARVRALAATEPISAARDVYAIEFGFHDETQTITVEMPEGLAEAAESLTYRPVDVAEEPISIAAVRAATEAYAGCTIIADLCDEADEIAEMLALTEDEYVELLACMVQAIPYRADTPSLLTLPPAVIAEGGACVDKSVLLAALLHHKDYRCAVMMLPEEDHCVVGIASDALQYRGTQYALIETTGTWYVGENPGRYRSQDAIHTTPILIEFEGSKEYHSAGEVRYLLDCYELAHDCVRRLSRLPQDMQDTLYDKGSATEELAAAIAWNTGDRVRMYEDFVRWDVKGTLRKFQEEISELEEMAAERETP